MIFGSCLGTVTSLISHEDDSADDHVGPGGDGEGVALLYRSICLIWMPLKFPPHPHSLLSLCKKGQGFPRHSIAVVPELCLFHHPKSLFFCDVNFYTSCNIFQEYLVPVPYVILLFRIFSGMYIYLYHK